MYPNPRRFPQWFDGCDGISPLRGTWSCLILAGVTLILPGVLADALWAHAERDRPHECVGAIGGRHDARGAQAVALYPLQNIAARPEREYLADPGEFLRALRAMTAEGLTLLALYHSHPHGPDRPSLTDTRLAAWDVPYVIADLHSGTLRAYRLPEGRPVPILRPE